ncbi:hypothetical protein GCM10011368_04740 [Hyunsoonleella pacifica]|nr:hypothetical protein GCM10011368_04740 [Hyunsoonleella pacifica]
MCVTCFQACDKNNKKQKEQINHYINGLDTFKDEGQYWHLEMKIKPKYYWSCTEVVPKPNKNELGHKEQTKGLQYHLLCQSIAGLTNRAVEQGKSDVAIWLHDHGGKESYRLIQKTLDDMEIEEQGKQTGVELATKSYQDDNGVKVNIKDLFNGYVLTDVENNPESNTVATVASHVYNSIIVDVRDKEFFKKSGYKMMYDASKKSTLDAWKEFKDKCSNKALVIMPVGTGELRELAIKNNLFTINLNKEYNNSKSGQNVALFEEILKWLKPGAPIYGWEQGVSEDLFVNKVSEYAHIMMPADWFYNTSLTSLNYEKRQNGKVKVLNPKTINFQEEGKKYISYYLSDGDNVQWMMNGFYSVDYYKHPEVKATKMGFGLPIDNLSMMAPEMLQLLLEKQVPETTIIQTFGGGYNYADLYGQKTDRTKSLNRIADNIAVYMKQHNVKILALMAKDVHSEAAREAYQTYVNANDKLEGILAVQYAPYAGGAGDIMWVTNSKGYDIPVVSVKYAIWNFGNINTEREGNPTFVAQKLNLENLENPFSLISVHAWSRFTDIGDFVNTIEENKLGNVIGAGAAKLSSDKLSEAFKVVSVEELIWRIRMHYKPEQTVKRIKQMEIL